MELSRGVCHCLRHPIALLLLLQACSAAAQEYPECVEQNVVLRNAGAHAIFVDVRSFGLEGCWQDNCRVTDKFSAADPSICARACQDIDECTHWTFGEQDGAKRCFLRKSDAGREQAEGWSAAPRGCVP